MGGEWGLWGRLGGTEQHWGALGGTATHLWGSVGPRCSLMGPRSPSCPTGAEPRAARRRRGADPAGAAGALWYGLLDGRRPAPPHGAPWRPGPPGPPPPRLAPPRPAATPRASLQPIGGEGGLGGGAGPRLLILFVAAAWLRIGGGKSVLTCFSAQPIRLLAFFNALFSSANRGVRFLPAVFSPTDRSVKPSSRSFRFDQSERWLSSRPSPPNLSEYGTSSRYFSPTNQSAALFLALPMVAHAVPALFSPGQSALSPSLGGEGRSGTAPRRPMATRGAGRAPPDWYGRNGAFYWLRGRRGCTAGAGTERGAAVAVATDSSNRKLRCRYRNRKPLCRGRKRARREALGGRDGGVGDGGDLRARRGHLGAVVHLLAEQLQDAVPELRAETGRP